MDDSQDYIIGIDGGGTKTAAVILNRRGELLGAGQGGPSTYGVVAEETTRSSIAEAAAVARAAAGLGESAPGRFAAAFLGLGNVVSEADRAAVREIATGLGLAALEMTGVDHDCRAALAGGLSGRSGIVLIAGTGTSCYGRNPAGESWRAGGWGPLIDDEGSGYWLGIQAMRAAVRDYDGRDKPTRLSAMVQQALGLADLNDLMNRLYAAGMSRTEIAGLAPVVFAAAEASDPAAGALIRAGCQAMAECVAAAARRLGLERGPVELAVTGGLTRAGAAFFAPLEAAVTRRLAGCRVLPAELPPALGAGLLGLQMLGIAPSAALIKRLSHSAQRAGRGARPPAC